MIEMNLIAGQNVSDLVKYLYVNIMSDFYSRTCQCCCLTSPSEHLLLPLAPFSFLLFKHSPQYLTSSVIPRNLGGDSVISMAYIISLRV